MISFHLHRLKSSKRELTFRPLPDGVKLKFKLWQNHLRFGERSPHVSNVRYRAGKTISLSGCLIHVVASIMADSHTTDPVALQLKTQQRISWWLVWRMKTMVAPPACSPTSRTCAFTPRGEGWYPDDTATMTVLMVKPKVQKWQCVYGRKSLVRAERDTRES